jgi:hypothetical protein
MMSKGFYSVSADVGNWAAKGCRDGQTVVIRNSVTEYDSASAAVHDLEVFGSNARETYGSGMTDSVLMQVEDRTWLVGAAAETVKIMTQEATGYERYGSYPWYILFLATLYKLLGNNSAEVALTFSMPVSQFKADRAAQSDEDRVIPRVIEDLAGVHTVIDNGQRIHYEVLEENIMMLPEGLGALCYWILSDDGRHFTNKELAGSRIVLFDIGGYTTDILTWSALKPDFFNTSIELGLIDVRNAVNEQIKARYNRPDVPLNILDRIITTRQYKHAGSKPKDVGDVVDTAMADLTGRILRAWQQQLGSGIDFDAVLIAGGGAPSVGKQLAPQLNHANIDILPQGEAHIANAAGALRYRKFKQAYA